ncbi:hypothetical protein [Parenemella sanctibonifatiensis]|uniref:Uncharacterized protein n=1 Tax=Parenemella sanctibonifatiensis TaxID=2016505 RepID=A0A255EN75_9ACTN|nr:hypothetical protein [Parenemella sanctibonifatiensis]OYN92670.1 hypothetical protein CGZ91_04155 [Parenemella sanctibonifatiensis]
MTEPDAAAYENLTPLGRSVADRLAGWLESMESYVTIDPADASRCWYGSGYPGWGIQSQFAYLSAAATLGRYGATPEVRDHARERALTVLRYALNSHRTGAQVTADGRRWPSTWISNLGPERAGFAIALLADDLSQADHDRLREVRVAEATWLLEEHVRGPLAGIQAGKWGDSGKNWPESNIWNGAHLWRTASAYPDEPRAEEFRSRAVEFLLNGVSVEADAASQAVVDGVRVADVHRGANFFDSYSLDHHSYLNAGYMVICASNVAMAHFDFAEQGWAAPESLGWHQAELWQAIKPMIAPDGRLVRIGGDSRVRYAYCQEYLLHSLVYADRVHGDVEAPALAQGLIGLGMREQDQGGDGSFYGRRLRGLAERQPYYYTRLEADRAVSWAWWLRRAGATALSQTPTSQTPTSGASSDESQRPSIWVRSGETLSWHDQEHGFAVVRGPRRFASAAWHAESLSQTLVVPTDRSDLAEWSMNLAPVLQWEGAGAAKSTTESARTNRRLADFSVQTIEGGFVTSARVAEGLDLRIQEGWGSAADQPAAMTTMVVVALPDDATVVGLQLCRAGDYHVPLLSAYGLNLQIPDDVHTPDRTVVEVPCSTGAGVVIDDVLDVRVSGTLERVQVSTDQDPALRSIGVDQFRADQRRGAFFVAPGSVILDTAWAIRVTAPGEPPLQFERHRTGDHGQELRVRSGGEDYLVTLDTSGEMPQVEITTDSGAIS